MFVGYQHAALASSWASRRNGAGEQPADEKETACETSGVSHRCNLACTVGVAAFSQRGQPIAGKASNAEVDVAAIKQWIERYCATVAAGDFEGYRAFWTEDVVATRSV